jgi:RecA-family ATPase
MDEQKKQNEKADSEKGWFTPAGMMAEIERLEAQHEAARRAREMEQARNEISAEQLLLQDITEITCLVEPFLKQTGLACLAGSSDTGKSSLLRQLAIAIVTGQEKFIDFKLVPRHRSVIYVSTEDLERETSYLLMRQKAAHLPGELRELRFIFDTSQLLQVLDERLGSKPADMVIIDCFADTFTGDLKDTQQIRAYLNTYQTLARQHQCLFLFLHHTGKRTENFEPSKNNLLSGQGMEAKMRLVIELRTDLLNPNHRHLCIVKGNYLASAHKKESYMLKFDEQTFTFINTGERVPFEFLVKAAESDNGKSKYEEAKEMKEQGRNYEQIASSLGYNSKSSVTKLFDRAKKNGWDKDSVFSFRNDKKTD